MSAKIRYQVNKTWIEIDAANPKDAIKQLQDYIEVFSSTQCQACKSTDVVPAHREYDGHDYYSVKCNGCGAELSFGQHKTGNTLFIKRKDKDGKLLPNNGWQKYQKQGDSYEP